MNYSTHIFTWISDILNLKCLLTQIEFPKLCKCESHSISNKKENLPFSLSYTPKPNRKLILSIPF